MALTLGFRVQENDSFSISSSSSKNTKGGSKQDINSDNMKIVYQDPSLHPIGWDNFEIVPDLSNLQEEIVAKRMMEDLPEDEESTGKRITY